MKKLITITAGLMLCLGTTAFANWGGRDTNTTNNNSPAVSEPSAPANVTKEIAKSFNAKFTSAENISWKQREEFYFADFKVNKQDMSAAYNAEGELLGVSRNLKFSELPLHVEMSIRENYKNYKLDNIVTEMVLDGETTYYLQAENNSRYLKLKCYSNGQINVVKRIKKKLVGTVY